MEAAPNREHIRNMAEARAHVKRDGGCYIRPIFWPLPRPTTVHGIRHKGRLRKRAHSPRRGQGWSACVAVSHQRQFRRRSADAVGFVQSKFHGATFDPSQIARAKLRQYAVSGGDAAVADKIAQERADHIFSQPVIPAQPTGPSADQIRIAHALEYFAAQLGCIARTTAETESHLARIAAHYPSSAE